MLAFNELDEKGNRQIKPFESKVGFRDGTMSLEI